MQPSWGSDRFGLYLPPEDDGSVGCFASMIQKIMAL